MSPEFAGDAELDSLRGYLLQDEPGLKDLLQASNSWHGHEVEQIEGVLVSNDWNRRFHETFYSLLDHEASCYVEALVYIGLQEWAYWSYVAAMNPQETSSKFASLQAGQEALAKVEALIDGWTMPREGKVLALEVHNRVSCRA